MIGQIETQTEHESPLLFKDLPHILYFSKKSPFKESSNEDALAIITTETSLILAIADGAGGHPKGEEAATLVLNSLKKSVLANQGNIRSAILDSIEESNKELLSNGTGAKTTLTICEITNNTARGYQVGDSTLVICGQRGKLKYRSISHSPVGYGVEAGLIGEKEALSHPDLHYISNLVGTNDMRIEIGPEVELNQNDSVFLATDGIFDNFSPEKVIEIVRKGQIEEISHSLMNVINKEIYNQENSKKDDISFILFKNDDF